MVEIDARITGLRKPAYWSGILRRYGGIHASHLFLVLTDRANLDRLREWDFERLLAVAMDGSKPKADEASRAR